MPQVQFLPKVGSYTRGKFRWNAGQTLVVPEDVATALEADARFRVARGGEKISAAEAAEAKKAAPEAGVVEKVGGKVVVEGEAVNEPAARPQLPAAGFADKDSALAFAAAHFPEVDVNARLSFKSIEEKIVEAYNARYGDGGDDTVQVVGDDDTGVEV